MRRRNAKPPTQPRNAREAFDEYARATYREMNVKKQLDDWQKQHPDGDPGGMLAVWSDALQARDKAARKLNEFKEH